MEDRAGSGGCLDRWLVASSHLGDRGAVFAGQRLEHRGLHGPAETTQPEDVLGQQGVLDEPGVLGAVLRDDGEIVVVKQRTPGPLVSRVAGKARSAAG